MKMPNGYVTWRGSSRLDNAPIVSIVTLGSNNRKTGPMHQQWILRADMHPQEALRSGADISICGNCRFRPNRDGKRVCYVMPFSFGAVYKAFVAGKYPNGLPPEGTPIRLGAYGDPAAVPIEHLRELVARAGRHTGYTHQWRDEAHADYKQLLMASADTAGDVERAMGLGWRTFRVRAADTPVLRNEVVCPATPEGGHRTTCAKCSLCSGAGNFIRLDSLQQTA
jgi:hypothetical protein